MGGGGQGVIMTKKGGGGSFNGLSHSCEQFDEVIALSGERCAGYKKKKKKSRKK